MEKLVQGLHYFQEHVFTAKRELFERLSHGQEPDTLFITCSDSRINPNLITNTEPGELFIIRNAGNIIPPWGAGFGGETATIEYAVTVLNVKDIIVCGHTLCGAAQGLLKPPEDLAAIPTMASWLNHADAARRIIKENYTHLSGDSLWTAAVEENVLVQVENLRTHPAVAARLASGKLNLHAWTYKIQTGEIFAYDSSQGQFVPVAQTTGKPILSPTRAITHVPQ